MNIFENFNKAKQKFGENLARQAIEAKIPNQFVYAACKFNVENGTPFNDLYLLFSQWTTYVVSKNTNINVDVLDYNTFWKTIQDYKKQYGEEGKVYDDGTVSITHISSLEQMKKLPIKNLWCIRREKHWNEYQKNGARFYLITNNNYSDESNCRYVMVEMYANGEIGYWSTDNELIDTEGSTKRLPPLAEYQKTLGDALQKIQELQSKIAENKQYTNMNKITEQEETMPNKPYEICRGCVCKKYDKEYDEISRKDAEELYNRWFRTIRIGNDEYDNFYQFNKFERDGLSFEDCIRVWFNYNDGPVKFFVRHEPSQQEIDIWNRLGLPTIHDIEMDNKLKTENYTNMNKKRIRLTESDLHRIVKESVNRILQEATYGLDSAYRYKGYKMLKGGVVIDPNGNEIGKVTNPDDFGRMVNSHLSKRADDIENGVEKLPPSQPNISYGSMEDDGDYRRYWAANRLRDKAYPPFERHQITPIR